jgi:hypothetical protein
MGHPIFKHMSSSQRYDNKQAYNKDLSDSARLHYLENEEHDKGMSRKSSPANVKGSQSDHGQSSKEFADHEARVGTDGHGPSRKSSPLNDELPKDHPHNAKGEHKRGVSRKSSPVNNVSYGTGYIGGMSRYTTDEGMSRSSSPARVEGLQPNQPDNTSNSSGGLNTGNYYVVGGGKGTGGQSITMGMSQDPVVITAKGSGNNISSGKTRVEHRADKTRMKIDATDDTVIKARRVARAARLDKRAAKKEIRQGKRYARKKDKGQRIDDKFGVEGQGGKDYNV